MQLNITNDVMKKACEFFNFLPKKAYNLQPDFGRTVNVLSSLTFTILDIVAIPVFIIEKVALATINAVGILFGTDKKEAKDSLIKLEKLKKAPKYIYEDFSAIAHSIKWLFTRATLDFDCKI